MRIAVLNGPNLNLLSLPRPDSFLNTVCSLEESPSNAIVHHLHYVLDQPLGFSVFLHAG